MSRRWKATLVVLGIAVLSNASYFAVHMRGKAVRETTGNASPALDSDAQSPQGKIAFVSERDGNAEVYVMNADGTNPVNLTKDPAFDTFAVWSPF